MKIVGASIFAIVTTVINFSALAGVSGGVCDRSRPMVSRLQQITQKSCEQISSDDLAKITSKDIGGIAGDRFLPGDFSGLVSVTELYFEVTGVFDLLPGVLSGMSSLQTLGFSYISSLRIHSGSFAGLPNLAVIDASRAIIESLEPGTFAGLRKLTGLSMMYFGPNQGAFPANLLDDCVSLQFLTLMADDFSSIPSDIFQKLQNLKQLKFWSKNLTSIPNSLLNSLLSIENLYFFTKASSFPDGIFQGLNNLKVLSIDGTPLIDLSDNVFSNGYFSSSAIVYFSPKLPIDIVSKIKTELGSRAHPL